MSFSQSPTATATRTSPARLIRRLGVKRIDARCEVHATRGPDLCRPPTSSRARFVGPPFEVSGAKETPFFRRERVATAPRAARRRPVAWSAALPSRESDATSGSRANVSTTHAFARAVGSVGVFTLLCKLLGLLRETLVAARFGVGVVVDAHAHAATLPAFFFVAIGGLNGPLHSVLGAAFSDDGDDGDARTSEKERDILVALSCSIAFCISALVFLAAESAVRLTSPGLPNGSYPTVAGMLRIMSPCIFLAAVNGVQMAKMTAKGKLVVPVLSPGISSACVMVSSHLFGVDGSNSGFGFFKPEHALAVGTTLGAVAQCAALSLAVAASNETSTPRIGGNLDFVRFVG